MLEEIVKTTLLTIVQAITEILPVSSSGHLMILAKSLDLEANQLYLTYLHFGTALALITYYRKDLLSLWQNRKQKAVLRFLLSYIIGMLLPVLVGVFFEDFITSNLRSPNIISTSLIFWGVVMIIYQIRKNDKIVITKKPSSDIISSIISGQRDVSTSLLWKIILIGSIQVLILIPGTSRSGITMLTALALGFTLIESIDLSFFLGIPLTLGPFVYELIKPNTPIQKELSIIQLFTGLLTFPLGYLVIRFFHKYKLNKLLGFCGVYRIMIGLLILLTMLLRI